MTIYKGYTIKKVTHLDWIIYEGPEGNNWCAYLNITSEFPNPAKTLKEAKARIDAHKKLVENFDDVLAENAKYHELMKAGKRAAEQLAKCNALIEDLREKNQLTAYLEYAGKKLQQEATA